MLYTEENSAKKVSSVISQWMDCLFPWMGGKQ